MSIYDALYGILNSWPTARQEAFASHPTAAALRGAAARDVEQSISIRSGLSIKGSAGAGQWAAVPWIAIFDDVVTDSATQGYYLVYLFSADGSAVHLSLNQGTTATRDEFKGDTRAVLRDRAGLVRRRLEDFAVQLPSTSIDLASSAQLPADYEAGHAMGVTYPTKKLPSDAALVADLNTAVAAYRALTFRGGLDPSPEPDDDTLQTTTSLIELRRYKMHRRIERNPKAAKEAKKHHGVRCQACDVQFEERYGQLGKGFIEAHHLRPISSLAEGVAVSYEVATDFAVLCSNCHRMIHRTADPSDVEGLRRLITP